MKKSILSLCVGAVLLTGCMSTSNHNGATLDRNEAIADLNTRIEAVGFNHVQISPGVDEFLNVVASLLERQHAVMGEYRTLAESHADVAAFLYAYQNATPEELELAIVEFDAGAMNDEERIGPKIVAYEEATSTIRSRNLQLGLEITAQLAQAAIVLSEHGQAVAMAAAANSLGSFMSRNSEETTADNDLGKSLVRARERLNLAREANGIIKLEKDTIDAINDLQIRLQARG